MALTKFVTEWGTTYNAAAIVISKDIKSVTTANAAQGKMLKTLLDDAQSPLAVLAAMGAIDKIDLAAGNPKDKLALPGNLKLFKVALEKLDTEAKKYVKVLKEAQALQPTISQQGFNIPTPLKTAVPATYRQLKIMQTEIEAIYARAVRAYDAALTFDKSQKIADEKNEKKDKVKGSDDTAMAKVDAIQEEAAMKNFLLAFGTSFKSSIAKGAAGIQKIKATPNVATYNDQMNYLGRDISQNLVNISKLKQNPKFKGTSLAKRLPDPGALAREIVPYANGNMRALDVATTTEADVIVALKGFSAVYKRIAVTYADVISGKIK